MLAIRQACHKPFAPSWNLFAHELNIGSLDTFSTISWFEKIQRKWNEVWFLPEQTSYQLPSLRMPLEWELPRGLSVEWKVFDILLAELKLHVHVFVLVLRLKENAFL